MPCRDLNIAGLLVKRGATRWDDAARRPGAPVPPLRAYRNLLEGCFGPQAWEGAPVPVTISQRACNRHVMNGRVVSRANGGDDP
jgi:hypothetical protein